MRSGAQSSYGIQCGRPLSNAVCGGLRSESERLRRCRVSGGVRLLLGLLCTPMCYYAPKRAVTFEMQTLHCSAQSAASACVPKMRWIYFRCMSGLRRLV